MILARTEAQTFSSPGFYVLLGIGLMVISVFLRLIVLVVDTISPNRWDGRWKVSRLGWVRFEFWAGVLSLVGGLIAFAATGRFFVG